MIELIKEKIRDNKNCNLSKDELIELYEINEKQEEALSYEYTEGRNNYEDFVKIFSSNYVARDISEINEDTIAYIGNLTINDYLPTFNLKYVYGDLIYNLNEIKRLENLEIVYKSASFENVHCLNELSNIEKIVSLFLDGVKEKDIDNIVFPDIVFMISLNGLKKAKNLAFPKSIRTISLKGLKDPKGLILPKELSGSLYLNGLEYAANLLLPDRIDMFLYLNSLKKLDDLVISDELNCELVCPLVDNDLYALKNKLSSKQKMFVYKK